jgi:Ca2+-transporting ATPase
LKRAPAPGRVRLEVGGLLHQPAVGQEIDRALISLPGVQMVESSSATGNVLVLFDPDRWTPESLVVAAGRALGAEAEPVARPEPARRKAAPEIAVRGTPLPGRIRLTIPGLRRNPELEHPLEARIGQIPGVRDARANAWTGSLLVLFDADVCTVEQIVAACRELAEQAPPPIQPWNRSQKARKAQVVAEVEVEVEAAPEEAAEPAVPWHALDTAETAKRLDADVAHGLSRTSVEQRLARFGPNRMPEPAETSLTELVVRQFINAPTALLGIGAGISVATGGLLEAGLIVAVLGINAVVGAATERTGQRAIGALRRTAPVRARVLRDGLEQVVDADLLVPGDVIHLLPNDPVPADARVLDAQRLMVEESALTGESRPVDKIAVPVDPRLTLADRRSVLHRGTTVVGGRGRAIVVETGPRTAIGALHVLAAEAETPPTPLERDLDQLGRWLAGGAGVVCAGVGGLALAWGGTLYTSMELAVSLGVAAIPEGLTALATSVLALASRRMRREGTLIRTLGAAEALGSVTVVCADKTGTLTENRMAAREMYVAGQTLRIGGAALDPTGPFEIDGQAIDLATDPIGPVLHEALLIGVLNSDAELETAPSGELVIDGSATEGALQVAAVKAGCDTNTLRDGCPRLDLRDRSEGRRHMVTVHRRDGQLQALLKGSPEEVLAMCGEIRLPSGTIPLEDELRAEIGSVNAGMAGRAMRVLGLGIRNLPEGYDSDDLAGGYTFLGLIGLVDPIRPAVPAAIKALHGAGIRTVMITGDQALTATAVARELGLSRRGSLHVLEAGDLTAMNAEALRGLVGDVGIFARVPPEMKLAVVRALQANGEVVAMTGDGVNDGPALRAADVGVAMGERGTELARELADVVLSTDDFTHMVNAVEEGRLVRENVRRVLHYMLSTNASEIWVVVGAVAVGLPSPLTPLQLLWLNLVTDIAPGLGLAVEPREPDLMTRPPRDPQEPIIPGKLYRRMLVESAVIAGGALAAYGIGVMRHGVGPVAQTLAFASLLGAQLLHVPLARAGDAPATAGGRPRNKALMAGMAVSAGLQLVALFVPPVTAVLGGAALPLVDLGIAALGAIIPVALIELDRIWRARREAHANRLTPAADPAAPEPGRALRLATETA